MTDGDYKLDASQYTSTATFTRLPPAKWKMRLCNHDYGIVFKAQPGMMPPYDTVPAAFARTLERGLILAIKGELTRNLWDNSQQVANYHRAACGVESSADSAKPQGSQVNSPAVAHPSIAAIREGSAK